MKHALLLLAVIATQAQAQIIYTDVIPDATYNVINDTCYLDLDNNGQVDYKLYRSEVPQLCGGGLGPPCVLPLPEQRINIDRVGTNEIAYVIPWGSSEWPQSLSLGQIIDANTDMSETNHLIRRYRSGGGCPGGGLVACSPDPPITWALAPQAYLGLRFDIGGATHYGWARLGVPSATSFTLRDYAYNSVPGEGILAGQTQCTTPFAVAVNNVDSNSVFLTWEAFGTDTFNLRYRPTGTAIWSQIDTMTTTSFTATGLTDCTEYEYQLSAVCTGGTTAWSATSSFTTLGCGACLDISYCPSASNSAADMWIAGVQVGTLNHQSGSNSGYGDHTAFGTELEIGALHPITLTPGYDGGPSVVWFKVFVDMDHNGDFNGTGELAYNAGGLTEGPISGTLNIPEGALTGRTRMRVIMRYANAGAVGCTNAYPSGETEDYCVDLVNNTTSVGERATSGLLHVFPNPFTSILTVSMGMHKAGVVTCTVRAVTGQALLTRTVAPTGGPASITLDLASLAPGTYLLEMQVDGERMVRKVVKE